jgi:hypothetical protein
MYDNRMQVKQNSPCHILTAFLRSVFYIFKTCCPRTNALAKSSRRITRIYDINMIRIKRPSLRIRTSEEAKIFVIYVPESVVIEGFFDF